MAERKPRYGLFITIPTSDSSRCVPDIPDIFDNYDIFNESDGLVAAAHPDAAVGRAVGDGPGIGHDRA